MQKLTIAFAVAMTLMTFGCKKKTDGGAGDAMAKMTEFKDEMCKCKDAKCAQDVSDKMTKWSQDQAKTQKEPPKMDEATQKKATEIGTAMGDCMQKAMGAGAAMGGGAADGSAAAAGSAEAGSAAAAGSAEAGSAAPAAAGSAEAGSAAAGSAAK